MKTLLFLFCFVTTTSFSQKRADLFESNIQGFYGCDNKQYGKPCETKLLHKISRKVYISFIFDDITKQMIEIRFMDATTKNIEKKKIMNIVGTSNRDFIIFFDLNNICRIKTDNSVTINYLQNISADGTAVEYADLKYLTTKNINSKPRF